MTAERTEKKVICIRCPRGCEVTTSVDGYGAVTDIRGNFCKLGVDYVRNEIRNPLRTVTTTVRVKNGAAPLVPVWTEKPVPKNRVLAVANALRSLQLEAPVKTGDKVLINAADTGVDVLASADVDRAI